MAIRIIGEKTVDSQKSFVHYILLALNGFLVKRLLTIFTMYEDFNMSIVISENNLKMTNNK